MALNSSQNQDSHCISLMVATAAYPIQCLSSILMGPWHRHPPATCEQEILISYTSRALAAGDARRTETRLRGWGEEDSNSQMSFRRSLLQVGSRRSLVPMFAEPRNLPNIINGFLKMTFASSSPLHPSHGSVSVREYVVVARRANADAPAASSSALCLVVIVDPPTLRLRPQRISPILSILARILA
jgi:hypothetical protein